MALLYNNVALRHVGTGCAVVIWMEMACWERGDAAFLQGAAASDDELGARERAVS